MTSRGNGLSRAFELSESQDKSIQAKDKSHSLHLQQILARRPKITGKRGRPNAVETLDEHGERASGINSSGNARVYTSQTEPYRELLCGMVQQAFEDAANDKVLSDILFYKYKKNIFIKVYLAYPLYLLLTFYYKQMLSYYYQKTILQFHR